MVPFFFTFLEVSYMSSTINFKQKGDFSKLNRYFERLRETAKIGVVEALSSATPKETGKTASSWYYEIKRQNGSVSLEFYNSNVNKGVPIAIILQYGHGTGTGGWVEGIDYINPVIQPLFKQLADDAWKEVTKL